MFSTFQPIYLRISLRLWANFCCAGSVGRSAVAVPATPFAVMDVDADWQLISSKMTRRACAFELVPAYPRTAVSACSRPAVPAHSVLTLQPLIVTLEPLDLLLAGRLLYRMSFDARAPCAQSHSNIRPRLHPQQSQKFDPIGDTRDLRLPGPIRDVSSSLYVELSRDPAFISSAACRPHPRACIRSSAERGTRGPVVGFSASQTSTVSYPLDERFTEALRCRC